MIGAMRKIQRVLRINERPTACRVSGKDGSTEEAFELDWGRGAGGFPARRAGAGELPKVTK